MGVPNAISAQGTLIARSPSGGPFVTVGELRDITPPPLSRNTIETTSHNEIEESFVVGIRRKGEMTFQVGFVPSGSVSGHDFVDGIIKSYIDGARDIWRITFPDTSVWLFSGFVSNVGPTAPVDDGLVADVTVRPTGLMAFSE